MTNTEVVKGMYEAFGRGDIGAILNSVSENIDWTVPGPTAIPYAGHYRGRQEVTGFFQKLADTTEFDPFQIDQYVEQGSTVIAVGSYSGRSKPQKKGFQSRWAMVFTLSGGKVTKFEEHTDTAAIASAYVSSSQGAKG